jgi:hypothetical protein
MVFRWVLYDSIPQRMPTLRKGKSMSQEDMKIYSGEITYIEMSPVKKTFSFYARSMEDAREIARLQLIAAYRCAVEIKEINIKEYKI